MAIFFENDERNVIPNWRDFERTVQLGELRSSGQVQTALFSKSDLDEVIKAWNENNTIAHAGDLISSAIVTGLTDIIEVDEATNFIIKNKTDSPKSLYSIANRLADKEKKEAEHSTLPLGSIDELKELHNENFVQNKIRILKKSIKEFPRNAIKRVEVARMYSLLGQNEQARKSMYIALKLAPNNRYVLRSATRLFVHINDIEIAHMAIRDSRATKYDPWLLSSEIALASLRDRHSSFFKDGLEIIKSQNFSNFDITELASSLASIELKNGSHKKARRLFDKSLLQPNDNSLAQYEWASNKVNSWILGPIEKQVINPFEAKSLDNYHKKNWGESIDNAIKWLLDLPFTKRPIYLGSFVSSMHLKDYKLAVELCKVGLIANPKDPSLINNLAYNLALNDQPNEAFKQINKINKAMLTESTDIIKSSIIATKGLVYFRMGFYDVGRNYYWDAINFLRKNNLRYYSSLAYLNLLREEIRISSSNVKEMLNHLDKFILKNDDDVLNKHKREILSGV